MSITKNLFSNVDIITFLKQKTPILNDRYKNTIFLIQLVKFNNNNQTIFKKKFFKIIKFNKKIIDSSRLVYLKEGWAQFIDRDIQEKESSMSVQYKVTPKTLYQIMLTLSEKPLKVVNLSQN